jgi:hypothetical protein
VLLSASHGRLAKRTHIGARGLARDPLATLDSLTLQREIKDIGTR